MACRVELASGRVYRYCPDDLPLEADRVRAIAQARVVDEITERPLEVETWVTTGMTGPTPRSAPAGVVGLVGQPARLFPTLDVSGVPVDLRVAARGYLPLELTGFLGPIAGFPDQFAPLDLGDVGLHRAAVGLRGRTLQRASLAPTVVDTASVSVIGYWPTFPPAGVSPPVVMQPPNLVALSPGFYRPRPATATLRQRDLVPVAGQEKMLLVPAAAGESRLRLSDRDGLASGLPLVVGPPDPGRRERILIDQVDTSSAVDQPAWVTLVHALAHTHLDGEVVVRAVPQAPGANNALTRDAQPGDETAFLDGVAGLGTGTVVEIDDGSSPPEYHQADLYQATSDADGFFRLPRVSRVAMLLLHAERIPLTSPDDFVVTPDYRVGENRLTVLFP